MVLWRPGFGWGVIFVYCGRATGQGPCFYLPVIPPPCTRSTPFAELLWSFPEAWNILSLTRYLVKGTFMIYTLTANPAIDYNIACDGLSANTVTRTRNAVYTPNGKGLNVSFTLDHYGVDTTILGFLPASRASLSSRALRPWACPLSPCGPTASRASTSSSTPVPIPSTTWSTLALPSMRPTSRRCLSSLIRSTT